MGLLWSPICLWVVFLLASLADAPWWKAAVLSGPPMAIELFICLSTWYVCKMTSHNRWYLVKTVWTHIIAAGLLNALWLFLIMLYGKALGTMFETGNWGNLYTESVPVFLAVGVSLYFIAILAHYLVLAVEKNRETEQEVLEQRLLASQAELKALKATVHPHFLFNSLNLLSPLMRSSKEKAQKVVSQLSDFLLYSLRYGKQELVTIEDELDHVKNYLGIESVRLGDRLELRFDVDDDVLSVRILPLTLLPLVENAIKHGIGQCIEGGTLAVSIKKAPTADEIAIEITNPYEETSGRVRGEGLGLKTLKQRIATYYGTAGRLVTHKDNRVFRVEVYVPPGVPADDKRVSRLTIRKRGK
ncbi:MAG: hypothetical protein GY950_36090 [bacterium]|nr:hypothetical protein [bacterium]